MKPVLGCCNDQSQKEEIFEQNLLFLAYQKPSKYLAIEKVKLGKYLV